MRPTVQRKEPPAAPAPAPRSTGDPVSYAKDARLVLTLDAGGTKFVFSAVRGGAECTEPVELPSLADDLEACLAQIVAGFQEVHNRTGRAAVALSFAFPGPADYPRGIIGDLANLPAFRNGVALGPMLEHHFDLPVFINNDGDLFTYGEALAGLLPEMNAALEASGSTMRYRNLLGVTLGTGFGAGIARDGRMFVGDNAAAGEIWALRSKLHRDCPVEEDVSVRALQRVYAEIARMDPEAAPEPKVLEKIARHEEKGHSAAAREAFRRFGEALGDALANAITLIDGLVVIGGGLSGAAPLFLPAVMAELNGHLQHREGTPVTRLESRAFNLEDDTDRRSFLAHKVRDVPVPGTKRTVPYDSLKRIGVGVSRLGTSRAVALGAYAFALERLGERGR
jgi:glucokinase